MFQDHQPIVSQSARAGADGFKRVCQFVLSTIRVGLPTACDATRKLAKTGNRDPSAFFGHKLDGLAYLETHAEPLWALCEHLAATLDGRDLENALVDALINIPGIGLAKAGFIAQLVYGCSGCIDTHNLIRFGMRATEFKYDKCRNYRPVTRQRHIERYNETVSQCGGTEKLWDDWCTFVSDAQRYGTPEQVSAMHLVAAGV